MSSFYNYTTDTYRILTLHISLAFNTFNNITQHIALLYNYTTYTEFLHNISVYYATYEII